MAFRSDDPDYRWAWPRQARDLSRDTVPESLSLSDTLRELAFTIAGFVGVILVITTVIRFLQG